MEHNILIAQKERERTALLRLAADIVEAGAVGREDRDPLRSFAVDGARLTAVSLVSGADGRRVT